MKIIKLWGRNGTLEIEVVLIDNVGVDGNMTALRREGELGENHVSVPDGPKWAA